MSIDFFEDLDKDVATARPQKAYFALNPLNPDNEDEVHRWLIGELQFLMDRSQFRLRKVRRNLALYKGIQYEDQENRQDLRDRSIDRARVIPKIVSNHLFDLTQNRVSRLIKFKPAVAILPTNDEFEDKQSAKTTKELLSHIWYINNFESDITPDMATKASITGEAYTWVTWDREAGDIHEDSPKEGEREPLLDENGNQEKDDSGQPIWIEKPVKTGDVKYEVVMPHAIFLERKEKLVDVNYCFRRHVMTVEEARTRWPKKASKIKGSKDNLIWDFERMELRNLNNEVVVYEFWHKKRPELDKGSKHWMTLDTMLETTEHPYSHGMLPFVRFTDIDLPGEVHGDSFFETVKQLTGSYNNILNMVLRNEYLCAHPKWMLPAGAANLSSLGNDVTVVQFKGTIPPQLVQANPTSPVSFQLLQSLKEEFQQISGVFGVSRGEPPPGIKAGVALQFLNEQESERFNQLVLKWNEYIRSMAQMTLAVAGDFYQSDDNRMIRVMGKNNEWRTVFFDSAHLSKDYDIRIQNSSALPQSKAARVQTLLDLQERFPDQFTASQVLEMLDLGQSDKFLDQATVSVQTAEAENELILSGEKTAGVKEYEDHISHWREHVKEIFKYSFKEMTPKKIQEKFIEHILATEMFMADKAAINPAFAEELQTLRNYPLFYEIAQSPDQLAEGEEVAAEAPGGAAPGAGALALPPDLPVNPEQGGPELQQGVPEAPNLDVGGGIPLPEPGPIEPTRGI